MLSRLRPIAQRSTEGVLDWCLHLDCLKMHQGDTGLRIALEIAQHEHLLQLQTEKAWGLVPDNASPREIVP